MKYELLYIVPSSFSDTEIEGVQKEIAALVAESGGTISRDEILGKIKLAYPIKKVRHGTYILVQFEIAADALVNLEAKLRLEDKVLRHLITQMPAGAENKVYQIASYVAPLSAEGKRQDKPAAKSFKPSTVSTDSVGPVDATPEIAPATPAKLEETAPAMTVEELDKKLDEILDADVLKDI